uniref:Ixodegrin B n=1 Tax=Rhipicephalus appendiculatus TaxID=34631 RepID=A0A131Z0R2_RHIAP
MESNSVNSLNAYAFLLMTFIATTTEGQHFPLLLPSVPRRFNQACNYTCQCDYGMCCLQRNGRQTCQLEASRGQPCTFLAFGGVYRNACPCASGEGADNHCMLLHDLQQMEMSSSNKNLHTYEQKVLSTTLAA